jgi:hypothetical protein
MTIQEIITQRMGDITHTLLHMPHSNLVEVNLEFLQWLNDKFPAESKEARWAVLEGQARWPKRPSRDKKMRENSHRFYMKRK